MITWSDDAALEIASSINPSLISQIPNLTSPPPHPQNIQEKWILSALIKITSFECCVTIIVETLSINFLPRK